MKKSLIFEEDNTIVKCEYHTGPVGNCVKEFKGFKVKMQRLIVTRPPTLKKEPLDVDILVPKPYDEESKGPIKPLKIMYHKEDII